MVGGMKSLFPSQWAALVLGVGMGISFFLPWVRLQPADPSGLVDRLVEREDHWVYDYVIMHSWDWKALLDQPSTGISGYQLAVWGAEESYEGELARMVSAVIFSNASGPGVMQWLWVMPVAGLGGVLVLLIRPGAGKAYGIGGGVLLTVYLLFRWRMATALNGFLVAEMVWNLGLWIQLYAALVLAFLLIGRAFFPGSRF